MVGRAFNGCNILGLIATLPVQSRPGKYKMQIITSPLSQYVWHRKVESLNNSISKLDFLKIRLFIQSIQSHTPWPRNSKTMIMNNQKHCQLTFQISQQQSSSRLIKVLISVRRYSPIWCVKDVEVKKCKGESMITLMSVLRKKLHVSLPYNDWYANRINIRPEVMYWTFRQSRISTSLKSRKKFSLMIVFNRMKTR